MESYIVINGKKAPLTEDQLKMLGIETEKKNPLKRCEYHERYYHIDCFGKVNEACEDKHKADVDLYEIANYCTDKNLLQQRAWHETLNRLLWRYSMEHDGDKIDWNNTNDKIDWNNTNDKIDWNNTNEWKYYIYFNVADNKYAIDFHRCIKGSEVYFHTEEIAENAIKEIVEPFMAEHPDFVW
jgi:hypothetical protein